MKTLYIPVLCSQCGKKLKGVEQLRGLGFHVRRHKDAAGFDCWGSRKTNHLPVVKT